jgi:glycerol-3-phosphate dehydrogenase
MTSYSDISNRDLTVLSATKYDVLIIGGGISGAWLALHCAQQGYRTALIEKYDYASQTSSSSSKLIHGGVRYLQQMQFGKVRESAMERAEYLYAAPHLSEAVPFIIPTYKSFQKSKFFLGSGMIAYQALCLGENKIIASKEQQLPPIKLLSKGALNELCDLSNEDHTGGVVFYERHMLDSERMVLAIVQSAQAAGADVFNYVSAQSFIESEDSISGVVAKDELNNEATFSIKARLTVNSAGPWIDNLNSTLKNADKAPSINGFAVGSHIVTRQLYDHAIAITTKHQSNAKIDRGGRHVFIIPWRGFSLIGTSYDDIDGPNGDISLQASHVDQLLEAINEGIPSANLTSDDLVSGYTGLYILHTDNIKSTVYQGSGEYQIIDHANANGVSGLITALGAKFTTGRKLSELTMRVVNKSLDNNTASTRNLERTKLIGSDYQSLKAFSDAKIKQYNKTISAKTVQHLIMHYGSRVDEFVNRIQAHESLFSPICSHQNDIFGQVIWAIEEEQCFTLNDLLFHRTSLGLLGIKTSELHSVATFMGEHLNWSNTTLAEQMAVVTERLSNTAAALKGVTA